MSATRPADGPVGVLVDVELDGDVELRGAVGLGPRSSSRSGGQLPILEPHPDGGAVAGQVLGLGQRDDVVGDRGQRVAGVVDDVHRLGERAHREPAGVAGAAAGGQHVVGAGAVVAEADRGVRADEDRAGVAHPGGPRRRRRRCGSRGARRRRRRRRRGPARGRRPARCPTGGPDEAVRIRSMCLVAATCRSELGLDRGGEPLARRHQHRAAASGSCSAWLTRSAAT